MGSTTEQENKLMEPVVTTIGEELAGRLMSPNKNDLSPSPARLEVVRSGIDG
jgi:hypothetical protein|tara:strand:+ start:66 stop:221 length:156 start_codon:yes stop_codon:yes gene_type:complete